MSVEAKAGVRYETAGNVAVLTVDNPPVNALSAHVRAGLLEGLRRAEASPDIDALVLLCAGRTFVAGADIREFGKPPAEPTLAVVFSAIEACRKPVVAAIHGVALGGGFELALTCRARIARDDARLGLPEIKLGIIPGGGGTQRLPRLVGVEAALDMILSGDPIDAAHARERGALDMLVAAEGDLREAAIAYARNLAASAGTQELLREKPADLSTEAAARWLSACRVALLSSDPEEVAGLMAINVIEIGILCGFEAGLVAERAAFVALRDSPRASAKREEFFAVRKSRTGPELHS